MRGGQAGEQERLGDERSDGVDSENGAAWHITKSAARAGREVRDSGWGKGEEGPRREPNPLGSVCLGDVRTVKRGAP
ncbi:hypothetical protein C2E23DRAFT_446320 [Lenzites betulinus]|nr:hypothetical protein C2E23DRAFT_446320 [Lenzites betulinus]